MRSPSAKENPASKNPSSNCFQGRTLLKPTQFVPESHMSRHLYKLYLYMQYIYIYIRQFDIVRVLGVWSWFDQIQHFGVHNSWITAHLPWAFLNSHQLAEYEYSASRKMIYWEPSPTRRCPRKVNMSDAEMKSQAQKNAWWIRFSEWCWEQDLFCSSISVDVPWDDSWYQSYMDLNCHGWNPLYIYTMRKTISMSMPESLL